MLVANPVTGQGDPHVPQGPKPYRGLPAVRDGLQDQLGGYARRGYFRWCPGQQAIGASVDALCMSSAMPPEQRILLGTAPMLIVKGGAMLSEGGQTLDERLQGGPV